MQIRKSVMEDYDTILALYQTARAFMKKNGNSTQWGDHYPPDELIAADITRGNSYVCVEKEKIIATFYFAKEEDPTYNCIYKGNWLNDKPYAVIHRIAVLQGQKGIASFCLQWCFQQYPNIRIDTHRDNIPMQKTLSKNCFQYCGIIYVADGSERMAYQRIQ